VSNKEIEELYNQQNDGIDKDFDQYLNLYKSFVDSLNTNQLSCIKELLLLLNKKDSDFITDLYYEIYAYLLHKLDNQ